MLSFIIGCFIGATVGITLICLTIVAKESEEKIIPEEIDYTTIYLSGFYNGEDKWKDKIKKKSEEILDYTFDSEKEKYAQEYAIARIKEILEEK